MNNAVYASLRTRTDKDFLKNHLYAFFNNAYANEFLLYNTAQFDAQWEYKELMETSAKFFHAEQPFDFYAVKNNIQLQVIIDSKDSHCKLSVKPVQSDSSKGLDFYIQCCIELCENYAILKLTTEEPGNEESDF